MRTISRARLFKRDHKRVMFGASSAKLDDLLRAVFAMLIADQPCRSASTTTFSPVSGNAVATAKSGQASP